MPDAYTSNMLSGINDKKHLICLVYESHKVNACNASDWILMEKKKMHDMLPVPVCYNITKSSGKKLTWKIFVKQYKRSVLKYK